MGLIHSSSTLKKQGRKGLTAETESLRGQEGVGSSEPTEMGRLPEQGQFLHSNRMGGKMYGYRCR